MKFRKWLEEIQEAKELSILSWNILEGGQDRFDDIVDKVKTLNPNIVTIQEAGGWNDDKLKLFSEEVKLPHFAVSQPSTNNSQTVIFSDRILGDVSKFDSSNHGIVGATIKTKIGDVRFYGIHLHSKDDSIKLRGLLSVHKDAKKWDNVILAGDFNSLTRSDHGPTDGLIGDKGYGVMEKAKMLGYQDSLADEKKSYTYPSKNYQDKTKEPKQRIDYVLVSEPLVDRLKSTKVLRIGFSDHHPIYCKIG